jgi:hypothetical protein
LILPPPHAALLNTHNHKHHLNEDIPWSDYVNLTSALDGTNILSDAMMTVKQVKRQAKISARRYRNSSNNTLTMMMIHALVVTKNESRANAVWDQYQRIRSLAATGQSFLWGFHTNVWEWKDDFDQYYLANHSTTTTTTATSVTATTACPNHVQMGEVSMRAPIKEEFFRLANISLHTVGYTALHIRRTDAIVEGTCDTSIDTILDFLRCYMSLSSICPKTTTTTINDGPLVIFTDEHDPTYLSALVNMQQQNVLPGNHHHHHRPVLLGDALVRQAIQHTTMIMSLPEVLRHENDNFFLFSIVDDLFTHANVSLWKERMKCQTCIDACLEPKIENTHYR